MRRRAPGASLLPRTAGAALPVGGALTAIGTHGVGKAAACIDGGGCVGGGVVKVVDNEVVEVV